MIAVFGLWETAGKCLEALLWFGVGAYLVWFWPKKVNRDGEVGKVAEQEAQVRFAKLSPRLGYLVMLFALVRAAKAFLI